MLDEEWELAPEVSLRPEPFGALAYHFGNRRLTFLRRPELVALVCALGENRDLRAALVATGIPGAEWPAYETALRRLAASDMIRRVPEGVVR
jgi:putative mycofactocin binding protein MftB